MDETERDPARATVNAPFSEIGPNCLRNWPPTHTIDRKITVCAMAGCRKYRVETAQNGFPGFRSTGRCALLATVETDCLPTLPPQA